MRSTRLLLPLLALSPALCVAAPAKADYSKRAEAHGVAPVYPIAYRVPTAAEVKGSLDRIKGYVTSHSSFKVYDNATGNVIPDTSVAFPQAVIDQSQGPLLRWDYTNGVIISGFDLVGQVTGDQSYLDYNVKFYDFIFTWMPYFRDLEAKTGKKNEFSKMVKMEALDHCGAITCALIKTERRHHDPRQRAWIDVVDNYISKKQFRLADGSLARQRPQEESLWTDDFYMSIPFLAQMGVLTGEHKYWDDAVRQVVQLSERLFNKDKGLYDHGWSVNADPYDPRFYWGRANGWATMAMCELLQVLPADYPGRDKVLHQFRSHIRSVVELQDGSGLWHNMLDKNDTYLETSASAMFTYALAKGVNEGWLSPVYAPAAITGWNGLNSRILADGRVSGICEGTTYAHENTYYYYRGASENTTFFGSVLYAGAEVIRLVNNPKLAISDASPGSTNSAIQVKPKK